MEMVLGIFFVDFVVMSVEEESFFFLVDELV